MTAAEICPDPFRPTLPAVPPLRDAVAERAFWSYPPAPPAVFTTRPRTTRPPPAPILEDDTLDAWFR